MQPRTSMMITRSERGDLAVFIGVELAKASRQIFFLISSKDQSHVIGHRINTHEILSM